MKDLKHFTRYAISVQACRERSTDPLAEDFSLICSLEKFDYVTTKALGKKIGID